jgi:hypothetical protein
MEPNWGVIYVYMEVSQQNFLCNYHKLYKMFFKYLVIIKIQTKHIGNR